MTHNKKSTSALWLFVIIVLGLPVLYWMAFAIAGNMNVTLSKDILGTLRGFGPTFAAVITILYLKDSKTIKSLFGRIFQWRLDRQVYGVALFAPFAAMALALSITFFIYPDALRVGDVNLVRLIAIFFILPIVDGPLGEEIGWRGFFLPLLMQKFTAVKASMFIGLVWFLWHLPHYLVDGRDMSGIFLPKYLIYSIALSFIHTWLFKKAKGSILIHVIFHNAVNYIVLLSFTIFPVIKEVPMTETIYFIIMVFMGLVAGLSLWRQE